MSESVLKQELPELAGMLRDLNGRGVILHSSEVKLLLDHLDESAALREEIKNLTLLSDSQLANQERLATGLVAIVAALGIADGTMPLTGPQVLLLADEAKHCCERLVGEKWIDVNQELPQMAGWVLVQIKERPDIPEVRSYTGELGWITWMAGHYPFNPATVIRWMPLPDPPATLAPKDTPTEPKSAPEEK